MADRPRHPSQAEGDRDKIEDKLGEQGGGEQAADATGEGAGYIADPGRPSKAEGSRSTVEADLNEKPSS